MPYPADRHPHVLEFFFTAAVTPAILFPMDHRLSAAEVEAALRASGAMILLTSHAFCRDAGPDPLERVAIAIPVAILVTIVIRVACPTRRMSYTHSCSATRPALAGSHGRNSDDCVRQDPRGETPAQRSGRWSRHKAPVVHPSVCLPNILWPRSSSLSGS